MFQLYADDVLIFQDGPATIDNQYFLDAPTRKCEIGKTSSISCTILPNHPRYQYIEKISTKIKAVKDGNVVFRGRVLDVSMNDIYGSKQITCEDALSFLNDSYLEKYEGTITGRAFLQKCIDGHNAKVDDARKITLGTVNVPGIDTSRKFTINAWSSPLSAIESGLINNIGGYLRIRYSGTTIYLDYLDSVAVESSQEITTEINLMDFSLEESGDGYFTVLIPTGDNDKTIKADVTAQTKTLSDGTVIETKANDPCIYFPNAIAKYGHIYHPESFSEKKNTADILAAAEDWIIHNYRENPRELSITALDLSKFGVDVDELDIAQVIRIHVPTVGLDVQYQATSFEEDPTSAVGKTFKFIDPNKSTGSMGGGGGGASGTLSGGAGGTAAKCLWAEHEVIIEKGLINLQAAEISLHSGRLDENEAKIRIIDNKVEVYGQEIDLMATDIVNLKGKTVDIDADLIEIGHSITDLETARTDMEADLIAKGYQITNITANVTTIGGHLTQAQADILEHETEIQGHTASILAINTDITDINSRVTNINGRITNINSEITNINSAITNMRTEYANAISTKALWANTAEGVTANFTNINGASSLTKGGDPVVTKVGDDPLKTFAVEKSGSTVTLTWTSVNGGNNGSSSFNLAGSVTLSGSWSGNAYTVTASNGKTITETLTPSPANASTINTFTNHMAYITVAATGVTQGPLFRWTVDATSEYNSGYNAGRASVKPQISASWSGGILTISTNPTAQANVYEYLGKGTVTWSGVTGTVPITAAPSSGAQGITVYTATVTAPFRNVQDDQQRNTFYAYYYNKNGSLESMGNHNWYYHT